MNKITKAIKQLMAIVPIINKKYRSHAEQVIQLFSDRKIEKTKEAENLLIQLASRGLAPQSAIKKITEKYSKAESATGKLSRPTAKNIANKIKTKTTSLVTTMITRKTKSSWHRLLATQCDRKSGGSVRSDSLSYGFHTNH